jgi:penicillin-binding protein 1A
LVNVAKTPSRLPCLLVAGVATLALAGSACTAIPQDVLAKARPLSQRSTILASDGTFVATLFKDENRLAVRFKDIPDVMKHAIIAAEDSRFYAHGAIDLRALIRALVKNVGNSDALQGGSTITMQLAKLMYACETVKGGVCVKEVKRDVKEKILEARIAIKLEQLYSKDEILTQYLNRAYFGERSYGISAAASTYFAEPLSKLTLPQAALLAGLVKEPAGLDPFDPANAAAATARRAYVLDRMVDSHYISRADADAAKASPLGIRPGGAPDPAKPKYLPNQFFVSYVQNEILNDKAFGATAQERADKLFYGGLTVRTTLDPAWNRYAWEAIQKHLGQPGDPEAALVSIDTHTGAVRAMIGGDYRNKETGQYNYAAQGGWQPGSSFKPFVLAAALDQGFSPDSRYDSSPGKINLGGGQVWDVHNSDGQGHGFITIHQGLIGSVNALFARLILDVGPESVVDMAAKAGINRDELLDPTCHCAVPSIALGSLPVTPLEMASAYSTFADNGMHYQAHGIALAQDPTGKTVFDEHNLAPAQTMDPAVAYEVTNLLQDVVKFGTGTRAQIPGRVISGKTGTNAPDHGQTKDVWFVGYTPDVVTAVWVGYPPKCVEYDRNKNCTRHVRRSMYSVHGAPAFGGTVAAPIWHDFMVKALAGSPRTTFTRPDESLSLHIHNGKPSRCLPSSSTSPSPRGASSVGDTVDECPTPKPSTEPQPLPSVPPVPKPTPTPSPNPKPKPSPSPEPPPPSPTPSQSAEPSPTPTST